MTAESTVGAPVLVSTRFDPFVNQIWKPKYCQNDKKGGGELGRNYDKLF
jgi:hypothetical protein